MKPKNPPIEEVLLDVRKAYRLLHSYQRMVLDAVGFIGKRLDLAYAGGWPVFSNPSPRAGRGGTDLWSWDWLNMVCYEFRFGDPATGMRTPRMSVYLISDSGIMSEDLPVNREPEAGDFGDVAKCKTELVFLVWLSQLAMPPVGGGIAGLTKLLGPEVKCSDNAGNALFLVKRCPFSRLVDEDTTGTLMKELVAEAVEAGIPLKTNNLSGETRPRD